MEWSQNSPRAPRGTRGILLGGGNLADYSNSKSGNRHCPCRMLMKKTLNPPQRWPLFAALVGITWAASCATANPVAFSTAEPAARPASARGLQVVEQELDSAQRVAPAATHPASTNRLSFDALMATALVESPDLRVIAARIDQAEASLAAARATWWPTIGLDASYLRADAPSLYLFRTIDAGRYTPGTDFNAPGAFSNWEAGVSARLNLYNGGRDQLNKGIAGDSIALAKLEAGKLENALIAAITDGWYSVRAAEEQQRTARASIETIDAQLAEARARHESGSSLITDVLSLEVRRAESEEMLLRATNGRALGLAALAQLAGLEQELEIVGEGVVSDLEPASMEEALALAMRFRPELEQAKRRVAQAERGVQLSRSSYLPRADLFARGWRDAPELDFDNSRDNWALGVSLSWDIFDGQRGAGVDGARARLDEARRAQQKARLGVQLDVRSAWLRVADAQARVEVTARAVATAEETLALVRAQYRSGAAPITRYLESELMMTESKTRNTSARYDLERARADLARAVGHYKGVTADRQ